ncbi:AAA family ATPase [Pseudomonas taiwanensis]|uniref:AAA family ATPase n=1 Tax=Pseudomonas taiwanensis TaxID=470150 RepID=UPI0028DF998C|nr:AAA family ATPase [Pseudomonas taiwanensis]MDT8924768.1 AAA family ATPase [Pseudomonas taiwanensis]
MSELPPLPARFKTIRQQALVDSGQLSLPRKSVGSASIKALPPARGFRTPAVAFRSEVIALNAPDSGAVFDETLEESLGSIDDGFVFDVALDEEAGDLPAEEPSHALWLALCATLGITPSVMLEDDIVGSNVECLSPSQVRAAVEQFHLRADTADTIVHAAQHYSKNRDFSIARQRFGNFLQSMITVARYWEGVEPCHWPLCAPSPSILKTFLKAANTDLPINYWVNVYQDNPNLFLDIRAIPNAVEHKVLAVFIHAWISRLCFQIYPDLLEGENLNIERAIASLIFDRAEIYDQQFKLLKTMVDENVLEARRKIFLIPLLQTPHVYAIVKEAVMMITAPDLLAPEMTFQGCLDYVWARHLLAGIQDRQIIHALLDPTAPMPEEYRVFEAEFNHLIGRSNHDDLRQPFKMMNLPCEVRDVDKPSEPVQTYLLHSTAKHLELLDDLNLRFPHFKEVSDYLRRKLVFAIKLNKPFHTGPILIKGPSGIGKTFYLKALKEALGLPALDIHASQITCGSALAGLQSTWGTGQPGRVSKHLRKTTVANSMVVFNELSQLKLAGNNGLDPVAVLLQLLDADESAEFVDAFTGEAMDLSKLNWFFTANHINNLDSFLLTRLTIFNVEPIKHYRERRIVDDIIAEALKRLDIESSRLSTPDDLCCRLVLDYLNKGGNMRRLGTMIEDAIVDSVDDQGLQPSAQLSLSAANLRKHLRA